MTYTIYIYKNLITGKYVYVGQTTYSLRGRAGSNGINYRRSGSYFGSEIEKYGGFQNFEAEVLTTTTDKEYADLLEWFYTIEFNTQYPNGCNNDIGRKHSREHILAVSKKTKGRPNPKNSYKRSEEHRRKISEALKGKPAPWNSYERSEEVKRKMSEVQHTETVLAKIRTTKQPMINAYRVNNPLNLKWNDFCHWYKENNV